MYILYAKGNPEFIIPFEYKSDLDDFLCFAKACTEIDIESLYDKDYDGCMYDDLSSLVSGMHDDMPHLALKEPGIEDLFFSLPEYKIYVGKLSEFNFDHHKENISDLKEKIQEKLGKIVKEDQFDEIERLEEEIKARRKRLKDLKNKDSNSIQ